MPQFAPVFEKDDNIFVVQHKDFLAENEEGAQKIGLGASIVECILWKAKFIHSTVDLTDGIMGIEAKMGDVPIIIIAGPLVNSEWND